MVLQIPVFFSLYKVLFVTIEMRHAPFFGWINDLSAPGSDHLREPVRPDPLEPARTPLIGTFLLHLGVWPHRLRLHHVAATMAMNPPAPTPPSS